MHSQSIDQSATAPRVIAMTDFPPIDVIPGSTFNEGDPPEKYSDPDDVQSMIRLLLYANELEIEALVASAGSLANIARKQNILDVLEKYEQVQPNLAKHDPKYPSADALRSVRGKIRKPQRPSSVLWTGPIPDRFGFVSGAGHVRWPRPSGKCDRPEMPKPSTGSLAS